MTQQFTNQPSTLWMLCWRIPSRISILLKSVICSTIRVKGLLVSSGRRWGMSSIRDRRQGSCSCLLPWTLKVQNGWLLVLCSGLTLTALMIQVLSSITFMQKLTLSSSMKRVKSSGCLRRLTSYRKDVKTLQLLSLMLPGHSSPHQKKQHAARTCLKERR